MINKFNSLYISGREISYVRNAVFSRALVENYSTDLIYSKSNSTLIRLISNFQSILRLKKRYDLVFIGFYGNPYLFLTRFFKSNIIFDSFISTYDTLCFDRKLFPPNSFLGKLSFLIDQYSLNRANHIIVDTNENLNYFNKTFKIPKDKMTRIFVSADENLFYPKQKFIQNKEILFYGTMQPLHGLEIIIRAANILSSETDYKFVIIGDIKSHKINKLSNIGLNGNNVIFVPPIPYTELPIRIANSTICLGGPFGETEKAKRVITGKTFQFMAMGKPIIVGNTDANKELLTNRFDAHFCELNNAFELASVIYELINYPDYLHYIGRNALLTYHQKANFIYIKNSLNEVIQKFK
jgi:glycosyltransferase involved in cell wall biosynthesis